MNGTLRAGTAMLAVLAGLGFALAQQAPQSQPGQPSPQPPASSQEQQQTTGSGNPQSRSQTDRALQTESGRAGKQEGGSPVPAVPPGNKNDTAVLIDGKLAAPGAPTDSQTVPSKYSARNAALDRVPIMTMPLPLSDDQKRLIYDSVSEAPASPEADAVAPTHVLPSSVVLRQLPAKISQEIPAVRKLHYARFANKVLLVEASNRIVVGVIEK
jgi:hypothetical protein